MLYYKINKKGYKVKIKVQAMGEYQTNCYIITIDNKDFIIDPGVGATKWVIKIGRASCRERC